MEQGKYQGSSQSGDSNESAVDALRRMREEQNKTAGDMSQKVGSNDQVNSSTQNQQKPDPNQVNQTEPGGQQPPAEKPKRNLSGLEVIEKIQYGLILASLVIFPSMLLPVPWEWAEFGKGIVVMLFSIVLVTLEVMKIFLTGKFSVVKGFLDIAVLIILLSFLVSTVLSQDTWISQYGFDQKLGTGVWAVFAMVLYLYIMRSFMKDRKSLSNVLFFLIVGISFSALLSLISFFGVNLFGAFNSIENLFVPGLPVVSSAVTGIVLWGAGVLLGAVYVLFAGEKSNVQVGIVFALSIINMLALNLFSLNQGLYVALLVVLAMLLLLVFMFLNRNALTGSRVTLVTILTVLLALSFVVFKVPMISDRIVESTDAITQVGLPADVTWNIVTDALGANVQSGIAGFGNDTFSIYYNLFKPASFEGPNGSIDITTTNFVYGANEILTLTGNRGVLGALIWLSVGVMLIYQLIRDFSKGKTDNAQQAAFSQMTDLLLLFVYASSFLIPFTTELYFLFFFLFGLRIMIGAVLSPKNAESFVVKLDILVERVVQSKNNYLLVGLAFIAAIVGVLLLSLSVSTLRARVQAMTIESRIVDVQREIIEADQDLEAGQETNYPFEKREEALAGMINDYSNVIDLQPDNSAYHRRSTILHNEYVTLLAGRIQDTVVDLQEEGKTDEEIQNNAELAAFQDELNAVIEISIERGESTTEKGPNLFSNWDTRGLLYANLLGLGLTNYADTGIGVTEQSILLNPPCYTCYYRLAEMYVVAGDVESAGAALTAALNINQNHIPSLILGSEIAIANENYETAQALLQRTAQILEELGLTEDPLYESITARLEQVEAVLAEGGTLQPDPGNVPDEGELPEVDEGDLNDADLPALPEDELSDEELPLEGEEGIPEEDAGSDEVPGDAIQPDGQ